MPQMNPMNWLLLLLFFNSILMMVMVKLHFIYKEVQFLESSVTEKEVSNMSLKI